MYTDEQLTKLVEKLGVEDSTYGSIYQAINLEYQRQTAQGNYEPPQNIGILRKERQHAYGSSTYLLEFIVKRTYTVFGELEPTYILHPSYEHLNELFEPSQLQTLGKLIHEKIKRLENDSKTSNEERIKSDNRRDVREVKDFINTVLK